MSPTPSLPLAPASRQSAPAPSPLLPRPSVLGNISLLQPRSQVTVNTSQGFLTGFCASIIIMQQQQIYSQCPWSPITLVFSLCGKVWFCLSHSPNQTHTIVYISFNYIFIYKIILYLSFLYAFFFWKNTYNTTDSLSYIEPHNLDFANCIPVLFHLLCLFVPCISYKLEGRSRDLIRLMFNFFGKSTSQAVLYNPTRRCVIFGFCPIKVLCYLLHSLTDEWIKMWYI